MPEEKTNPGEEQTDWKQRALRAEAELGERNGRMTEEALAVDKALDGIGTIVRGLTKSLTRKHTEHLHKIADLTRALDFHRVAGEFFIDCPCPVCESFWEGCKDWKQPTCGNCKELMGAVTVYKDTGQVVWRCLYCGEVK